MPVSGVKQYNTFVKGLVTEAGPLTYPENASLDEENFVLNRDGSRQRRLGMDTFLGTPPLSQMTLWACFAGTTWETTAMSSSP
jgi:hypothetical protein